jgi:hypothetical protein
VRQADILLSVQTEFEKAHQFTGKSAQTAIDKLTAEGFRCSLQYKMLPTLTQGSTDQFRVENVPMIYCSAPHVAHNQDDLCRTFWAGFEINWTDPKRTPNVLNQELGTSTVKEEIYFCRVRDESN